MRNFTYTLIPYFCWLSLLTSQTIVSTTTETRKLLLEEFGGIYCTYCPEGNEIVASILATYPDDVFAINIHGGSWAAPEIGDPDYRTPFANGFMVESGLNAFPAATLNRINFPGLEQQGALDIAAMSRWNWETAVTEAMDMPAIVNVAATATIDYANNEMNVYVEIYYTASSESPTNYLNIAVLQNNIHGPQKGATQGDNYLHQHLLRDMITGQWGVPIATTITGHFESRSFSYPLPTQINNVPLDWPNIELAIFITEDHQNVLNATAVQTDYIVANSIDANALYIEIPAEVCGNEIAPIFTIRNDGNEVLTSLLVEYRVNQGIVANYEWYGELNTFESEEIALPPLFVDEVMSTNNCLSITIFPLNGGNDENFSNNFICRSFELPPFAETAMLTFELKTDNFGYDIYWDIKDDFDNIIAFGGNETVAENGGGTGTGMPDDPGAYASNENFSIAVELPIEGCYTFRILDDYGDGLCCLNGVGFFYLQDGNENLIFSGGEFFDEQTIPFSFGTNVVSVKKIEETTLQVFPNPVTGGNLYYEINTADADTDNLIIELFNADMRMKHQSTAAMYSSGTHKGSINTTSLPAGIYFLKLTSQKGSVTKKVLIME